MRVAFTPLLLSIWTVTTLLPAQQGTLSDAEKKRLFLKAREEMRTIPAEPKSDTPPRPRPRPTASATKPDNDTPPPRPTAAPPRPDPEPTRRPAPAPVRPEPPQPRPTTPKVDGTVFEKPDAPMAPVVIEKSGVAEDQGEVPAPKQESRGWWPFGGSSYKYITRPVRNAIDRPSVRKGRWKYIVIHNSGTRQGSAKAFDYFHRYKRGWKNGLAYHFVIGNGTTTGDGQIEIGRRWSGQIGGSHVHSDYLNQISIGICLVGDYNRDKPTRKQLESLEELIKYLRGRVGRTNGHVSIVKAHRHINPPQWPTDCPGNRFPYSWLYGKFD